MSFPEIVFYAFSLLMVGAATGVIVSRNPVHSALFLVLTFFATSAIWLLLEAEFLAITLVLVYVGAVMVLFLFVVMMLDINLASLRDAGNRYLPFGVVIALLLIVQMVMVVGPDSFGLQFFAEPVRHAADYSNTKALGRVLYTDFVYPFQISGFILLAAMIGAIVLTHRVRPDVRRQKVGDQLSVRREDSVEIRKVTPGTGV